MLEPVCKIVLVATQTHRKFLLCKSVPYCFRQKRIFKFVLIRVAIEMVLSMYVLPKCIEWLKCRLKAETCSELHRYFSYESSLKNLQRQTLFILQTNPSRFCCYNSTISMFNWGSKPQLHRSRSAITTSFTDTYCVSKGTLLHRVHKCILHRHRLVTFVKSIIISVWVLSS